MSNPLEKRKNAVGIVNKQNSAVCIKLFLF